MILQVVVRKNNKTLKMRLIISILALLFICYSHPCSCKIGSSRLFGRKIAVRKRNLIVEKEQPASQHEIKRKKGDTYPESNANGTVKNQQMTAVAERNIAPKIQSKKKITVTLALDNAVDDRYIYSSSYSQRFNVRTKTVVLATPTIAKSISGPAMQMAVKPVVKPIPISFETNEADISFNNSLVLGSETATNLTKVSCELATDAPTQKIELRYTYEIDFNRTTRVRIIERNIFQSIVEQFLQCNSNNKRRQLETAKYVRRRIQVRRNLFNNQTFEFISLDIFPNDKSQRNETCTPIDTRSNCRVLNGVMTLEINLFGEDVMNKAKYEILSFIKASMDQEMYNSFDSGITATRYIEPDLNTLYASFNNTLSGRIKYSDSATMAPVPFPFLAHGLIGVGVLLLSLVALFSILQVKRRLILHEKSSDIHALNYKRSVEKEIDSNSSTSSRKEEDYTTNLNKVVKNNESFLFSGSDSFAEGDDILTENNTPPQVCFDHSILIQLPQNVIRSEKEI